jgi:integrase/recombinase XerC
MSTDLSTWRVTPTLGWSEAWAAWLNENNRSAKTVSAYLQDLRHYARWYEQASGQEFDPALISRSDLRQYFEWQAASRAAVNSRNRRLASLRVLAQWLIEQRILEDDPTERIPRAKGSKLPPRAKDAGEYGSLATVSAAGSHLRCLGERHALLALRDRVIFGLMGDAGLRISEVAGLDLGDLRLDQNEISVLGKGGVVGEVLIGDELKAAIQAWLEARPGQGHALITNWNGERITTGQIRRRLELIGQAAGVPVKPHDLRHTYIYRLLDAFLKQGLALPVAIDATRQQARHRDSRTTLTYLRARHDQIRKAVEAL